MVVEAAKARQALFVAEMARKTAELEGMGERERERDRGREREGEREIERERDRETITRYFY